MVVLMAPEEQTTNSLSLRNLGYLLYQVCIVKVMIGGAPVEMVDDRGSNHRHLEGVGPSSHVKDKPSEN